MDLVRKSAPIVGRILYILFLFFLFLVGIKLLGSAFKLLGRDFAELLIDTTSNPFLALLIGIISTAIVQSSSVTTSMIVGMVSAGTLTVSGAIPMIMGANIGTSVTNLLVSTAHISRKQEFQKAFSAAIIHDFFNIMAVAIFLPIEIMTGFLAKLSAYTAQFFYSSQNLSYNSPIKVVLDIPVKSIKHFLTTDLSLSHTVAATLMIILSAILIITALLLLTQNLRKALAKNIEKAVDRVFSTSTLLTMFIGMVITMMVQSSSITTSIIVPLAATGILTLENAFPLTLGANVGTTITALLASLAGNISGLTIALVHLFFNLFGIITIYPIPAVRSLPLKAARWLAQKTAEKKRIAFYYIILVFFIIPLGFIFVSRLW